MRKNISTGAAAPRRSSRRSPEKPDEALQLSPPSTPAFKIEDAVSDQNGDPWLLCGIPGAFIWVRKTDFLPHNHEVFARLTKLGAPCLTRTSRDKILQAVEAYQPTRTEHVAGQSGWAGSVYVFGDGTTVPPKPKPPLIVALVPDLTSAPRGSLLDWQKEVGPIVQNQTIPLFLLGVAFCALLRGLAPPDYHNVLVELVGNRACGKSIMGAMASSIFRGDPEGDTAGGSSWDRTLLSVDDLKRKHRDALIFLDETQLAGKNDQERNSNVQQTIFKMFSTAMRSRFGDSGPSEHSRFAFLSTSNTPLSEMVGGNQRLRDAALSRMITVTIDQNRPYGVLDGLPEGFRDAAEAMEALRAAVDQNYGWPARVFLQRLTKEIAGDEKAFKAKLKRDLSAFRRKIQKDTARVVREEKSLALIAIAGRLARKWGATPKEWGSVSKACLQVHRDFIKVPLPAGVNAQSHIIEYLHQHAGSIVSVPPSEKLSLRPDIFDDAAGFIIGGGRERELVISTKKYNSLFENDQTLLQSLRNSGLMKTERGRKPILSTKTPRQICSSGRSYRILIGRFHRTS